MGVVCTSRGAACCRRGAAPVVVGGRRGAAPVAVDVGGDTTKGRTSSEGRGATEGDKAGGSGDKGQAGGGKGQAAAANPSPREQGGRAFSPDANRERPSEALALQRVDVDELVAFWT